MKNDIKNVINIVVADGAQERAAKAAALLEADERLVANAKVRLGDVKIEKWWSVAAGMALIAVFILYTFYLTIPAVILLGLLAAFLIYVGIHLRRQRKRVEEAEPEISPNRCVDVFVRKALGIEVIGRDVSGYMSEADIADFGAALKARLSGMGIDAGNISVKADVKVTHADQITPNCGKMPVSVVLDCGADKVELKWDGIFAFSATGDCMLDTKLTVE